jgi:anti-sigma factor RsiW
MRRAVDAYLDGELAPEAGAEVARHLSICWECSAAAETLRLMKRALRRRHERTLTALAEHRLSRLARDLARHRRPDGASPG